MQFEEFDKKVKEAADHHHPRYDEQAWTKMEKLLNKHLPQKEDDRRRFIFFILLFLGLGGAGLLIFNPWKKDKKLVAEQSTTQQQAPVPSKTGTIAGSTTKENAGLTPAVPADKTDAVPAGNNDHNSLPVISMKTSSTDPVNTGRQKNNNIGQHKPRRVNTPATVVLNDKATKDKPVTTKDKGWWSTNKDQKTEVTDKNLVVAEPVKTIESPKQLNSTDKKQDQQVQDKPIAVNTVKPAETVSEKSNEPKKEDQPLAKQDAEKKAKNKNKKVSSFFFSFSAGPDMSYVNNNKAGEVKLLAGLGLGYTFRDRLTIRTGFYSGRKVYTASPDAYDPPAAFYSLYPYLEKVDANCKVYEIPVSLSYNFGKKKNWFVSTGLSTFLMKEETYNYFYKYTPQGNTYTNKWSIKDKNSHFFSVATISGGYKKDISKRVTLTAEPYLKLPVAGGVGYGKVKLNSGGVLFTIGVKPF